MDAVAAALRMPSYFDFDALFRLDAVVAAKGHELFTLLQIFLRCTPLAFFFRFTFCAIDSVHLNVSISIQ